MRKFLIALPLVMALTACGGGDSDGGGGSVQGPTVHHGFWTLVVKITAIVAGTSNPIDHTTRVRIEPNGGVSVISTGSTCGIRVFVNGNVMTYEETCVFPGASVEGGANAACTLKMVAIAQFVSGQAANGVFGPKSEVCSGSAASYSGSLIATRDGAFEPSPAPTGPTGTTGATGATGP